MVKANEMSLTDKWNQKARISLLGQTIVAVNYMDNKTAEYMGWYSRPIMFRLSNGTVCYISSDDEGNDGGALFMQDKKGKDIVLPVLSI
jgi:hypothetical protein